ncbi:serine/threonine protein kinase [Luteolibacter flavescens]|uniref:Serine/threonine protein kinase n=1 Tax=Luteolibacter flavescens TaxID=1859460 RepID=A0ABT3FI78_9BACT|nr:serine/threonine-protein kinase [Luteolibacter flavescens]MCW1883269.1 serine/threonine protein kinase [Luteolibacter flavescens]
MPEGEIEIAYCHACGTSMDVGQVAPFSNVECPSCGKHTRVKREFGPYTLLRRHAIGGMSVVFVAQDNTLDREVIVKILNEEYGNDEKRIAAFEEEARITASFSHPHVVRVFTTGRAFGHFYIAMELVPGGHFEHHIRERGSIPEAELLPLAIQVAAGLKAAQAAGLIHRDMKPGNILLDATGNAKIVDFGLALVTKGGKAQATEIWATPYYVPPETIEGLPEDFRSDMYAFGATLYHALAGKPPCDEESMDTNKLREVKRKILPLAKCAASVSPETCAAVDRAMAHDPALRFRSYDDLLGALEAARQRLAAGAAMSPAKAGNGSKRGGHGSEKLALAAAAVLIFGAVGFAGWWIMREEPKPVISQGNTSPIPVAVDPSGGESSAQVGSVYRSAGEALRAGDYAKARNLFSEVRDLPGVLQPTGSWAACEVVIAAYLDGKSDEARQEAETAADHIRGAAGLPEVTRSLLMDGLEGIEGFRPIVWSSEDPAPNGAALLVSLIAGLKNWEHGMIDLAMPHFDAVLAAEAKGSDAWVAPYQEILRGYSSDAKALGSAIPGTLPGTATACRALADELHAVHASLKTKGRAKFNLRALQLDLEKHARSLGEDEVAPSDPVPVSADPLADVRKTAAACRFTEAAAAIKSPGFPLKDTEPRVSALLLLAEAAASFLADLEDKLSTPPEDVTLELKDSTKLDQITGTRSGGIKILDATGSTRDVEWSEVSPDSVIELHRHLVKAETSEIERLRRHEQAIAFDLLAGDPARGKKAGESLALSSPAFKRRWDLVQAALE